MTSGPALDKKMDVMPYLTNAVGRLDPLHRRDPPPAQDGRGVHLPGHGRLPGRRRAGRGDVGPDDQPAAEEVHDHRRDHAERHALRPAPRPVPHARAPRVLRRRRPGEDRRGQRREAPHDDHPRRRLGAGRSGAGARPGSPTPASAGSATTPPPAPTATSPCRSPATRSTCRRSTPRGWTSRTAATSRRLINVFKRRPDRRRGARRDDELAVDTLTDEVEPYLLRRHFIVRTPRGRRATPAAYRHLGLPEPLARTRDSTCLDQRRLFE